MAGSEPIAVISLAARFPQARDAETFWSNLCDGVESIRRFTDDELRRAGIGDSLLRDPNYVKAAPVLDGADLFDAGFFTMSRREAELTDPQHRLFLELCWEALEGAGIAPGRGTPVGVFASGGGILSSYLVSPHHLNRRLVGDTASPEQIGNDKDFLATRVSYKLDLRGPAYTVQSGCSSSLVAVHIACQSLRARECDAALAGGVSIRTPMTAGYLWSEDHILSRDGHCRPFDAAATGTLFGSGAGVVVLKRLDDAIADGDPIAAVIRGSAINNDGGQKVSYWATTAESQAACMTSALNAAGVDPRSIGYLEAHGTGTHMGDWVEALALARAYGRDPIGALGSVKANVGHLEAAAGIAGLIKAVLALQHRRIPGSINFAEPNPRIDFAGAPFRVETATRPWQSDAPLRAAVSSLGIGGTNAHVILEEAPRVMRPASEPRPAESVRTARRLAARLETADDLGDAAHTANCGRAHLPWRAAVVAATPADAAQQLRAIAAAPPDVPRFEGDAPAKIAFLYTGQGSQYAGMARELYASQPVFRRAFDRCADAAGDLLEVPLAEAVFGARSEILSRTDITQPALFAVEHALTELWRNIGVEPAAVAGHSVGEYAAACAAGVFGVEEGMRLATARGRLMHGMPGDGAMAAVMADGATVARIAGDAVDIAALNGERNTVISGERPAIERVLRELAASGIAASPLAVSHAFHSRLMQPALDTLEELASRASLRPANIPLAQNLDGALDGAALAEGRYWREQMRNPVRWRDCVAALAAYGCDAWIEIGPQPVLLAFMREANARGPKVPSLRRGAGDWATLLGGVGALYLAGCDFDWRALDDGFARRTVALPTYPFERKRYWIDPQPLPAEHSTQDQAAHPFLGTRVDAPGDEVRFSARVSPTQPPYLDHHRVYGQVVVLGVSYLETALAAGRELFGTTRLALENVTIQKALLLGDGESRALQLVTRERDGAAAFELFSRAAGGWERHAFGDVRRDAGAASTTRFDDVRARCATEVTAEEYYERLAVYYGPPLRNLLRLWRNGDEALGDVRLPDGEAADAETYVLHPALLDACFQVVFTILYHRDENPDAYVPLGIERLTVHLASPVALWSHVRRRNSSADGKAHTFDVTLFAPDGAVAAEVAGLQMIRASRNAIVGQAAARVAPMYHVEWRAIEPPPIGDIAAAARDARVATNGAALHADLERLAGAYAGRAVRGVDERRVVERQRQQFARLREMANGDDPERLAASVRAAHPDAAAELALLTRCGEAMAGVLTGTRDPLELLFPGGDVSDIHALNGRSPSFHAAHDPLAAAVRAASESRRNLRILEIGAGSGASTATLLPLRDATTRYVFSDVGALFLDRARERFGGQAQLEFRTFDLERDPAEQGFAEPFDLVVAANVLHATAPIDGALRRVRGLLAPGGVLLLVEGTQRRGWIDLIFGTTRGWWRFADDPAPRDHALQSPARWREWLDAAGFADVEAVETARDDDPFPQALFIARAPRPSVPPFDGAVYDARESADVAPLLALAQSHLRRDEPAPLAIVTRGAHANPDQAALWGFGRVLALEHPERPCALLDVESDADLARLPEVIAAGETQAAIRGGRIFVPRLRRHEPAPAELTLREDAAYLVTGGSGGLAPVIARWLYDHGARHIVLASRSEGRPVDLAGVHSVRLDVADAAAVDALVASFGDTLPPLRGVFHAAGVLDDGVIVRQTAERFASVAAPKVAGAMNLHRATRALDLDHFVLFSSVAGTLGSRGQANHAAANAALDAFAQWRRDAGLPAVSIAWGPWGEAGAAVTRDVTSAWRRRGIEAMTNASALAALEDAMTRGIDAVVADIDWNRFDTTESPLCADFRRVAPPPAQPAAPRTLVVRDGADVASTIRNVLAGVLGVSADEITDPRRGFTDLGLDSLSAVELRNRLHKTFGQPMPATIAFDHPTLEALTVYITSLIGERKEPPPMAIAARPAAAPAAPVVPMTPAAVESALAERLGRLGF